MKPPAFKFKEDYGAAPTIDRKLEPLSIQNGDSLHDTRRLKR